METLRFVFISIKYLPSYGGGGSGGDGGLGGKVRPERGADSCAALVVPNVKLRMESEHSISILNPHNLLLESFTLWWSWAKKYM